MLMNFAEISDRNHDSDLVAVSSLDAKFLFLYLDLSSNPARPQ
jgi:hypothetical protein